MPTYEYKCTVCDYRFDAIQSMMDAPLENCPECGEKVQRLISRNVGISFKGSGFYVTDKKTSTPVKSSETTTPTAATTESKPESTAPAPAASAASASTPSTTPGSV